jgi:pimeloyl-ACP methyl ester carboxylesterase
VKEDAMPTIEAQGLRQHYELSGQGDTTVVWIHGIGASLEAFRHDVPKFPGFRHLIYDVRGMGQSEGTDGPVTLEDWACDLAGLLDALRIERAVVAGHSMGGVIAQRFAIDFPDRLQGLLLMATSSRVGAAATANWLKRADETERGGNPRLAEAQRTVAAYILDEGIKQVAVPTLIIVGDADPTTPPGGSVIMSRCIPGSELEIYTGIGHSPLHEEPKAVERVRGWLEQFR